MNQKEDYLRIVREHLDSVFSTETKKELENLVSKALTSIEKGRPSKGISFRCGSDEVSYYISLSYDKRVSDAVLRYEVRIELEKLKDT